MNKKKHKKINMSCRILLFFNKFIVHIVVDPVDCNKSAVNPNNSFVYIFFPLCGIILNPLGN